MTTDNRFLTRLLSDRPLILDGGLGTQLERQGINLNSKLWSARVLRDNPQAILDAHLAFFRAGAHCAISASYQATVAGYQSIGLTEAEARALIRLSVELACEARSIYEQEKPDSGTDLIVAASVGPYGAALGDGSEYTGYTNVSDQQLRDFHADRLQLLDQSGADVLACETIPSLQEAKILSELLSTLRTPAWICFSCRDGHHLSDGSRISEVAELFRAHPTVKAVGVNCTSPLHINNLIDDIKSVDPQLPVIVYPNSGEQYHADTKQWSGTATPEECGLASGEWLGHGATIIGGCCRMGPEHIEAIVRQTSSQQR